MLQSGEQLTLYLRGEESSFIRFNQGKVRQAGEVRQTVLTLRLIRDRRQAAMEIGLSGDLANDRDAVAQAVASLRPVLPALPEDPQLELGPAAVLTERRPARHPSAEAILTELLEAGAGLDLVGILATGPMWTGMCSSVGHDYWSENSAFNLDWCAYCGGEGSSLAVKCNLAGEVWDPEALREKIRFVRTQLALLARPARVVPPGSYRTWFEPAAVGELLWLLNGLEGFSVRATRTATSPLLQLHQGCRTFSPKVSLWDDASAGVAPRFDEEGFLRPDSLLLLDQGRPAELLVSSRSAREFGVAANGAAVDECAPSLLLAGGGVASKDILLRLNTGILVSNLWYLNLSDRNSARVTGMTRFASFWVENGEIVCPIAAMRLDDSAYNLLGDALEDLGEGPEVQLSTDTYFRRSNQGVTAPGALVSAVTYTL